MRTLIFYTLLIGLSGQAFAQQIPWRKGANPPGWVVDCHLAERDGSLYSADRFQKYNKCNSVGYAGYKNEIENYYFKVGDEIIFDSSVVSAHVVVTDIGHYAESDIPLELMGVCQSDMCYRALIYLNGDSQTGNHVATFVTTPGMPWDDGTGIYTPQMNWDEVMWRGNRTEEGYYTPHKVSDDMGLGGTITNRFGNFYIMDHYYNSNNENMPWAVFYNAGVAFHSSPTVNGNIGSHGCTRLKYTESRIMNYLARHTLENFTVETRFTERSRMSDEMRLNGAQAIAYGKKVLKRAEKLHKQAQEQGEAGEAARKQITIDGMGSGGLY
jgi:hypothetical protein